MSGWSLIYEGFDPSRERLREALCTLGNGYFATRGAVPEASADEVHYPGTYLAGGYNRLRTQIDGHEVENEDLVNMPNWLPLTFRLEDGAWFDARRAEILAYRHALDLRGGLLHRTVRFADGRGRRTRMTSCRLVHMGEPHLAALEITLTPENWSGRLEVRSALDGRVVNAGVARYRELSKKHLEPLETASPTEGAIYLKVQTSQSQLRVAAAARTRLFRDGDPLPAVRRTTEEPGYIAQEFAVDMTEGRPVTIEKIVALYTSRDRASSECGLEARAAVARAAGFAELRRTHVQAWEDLWRRFEIDLAPARRGADDRTTLILRLHIFHLLQTVSPHSTDLDAGVPARGLHGEAYRGHIFWDELFIFPILNLRLPEITRALLRYRYRRLPEARAAAQAAGYRGAMYPWQSGSNGREESQKVHLNPRSGRWIADRTHLQRHVNAAIAYNIWQYYQATGDVEFLAFNGAEMMFELARFWTSIASYNPARERYEILRVMGPDEYHDGYPEAAEPGLDNNAYTNLMAAWVLARTLEMCAILPEDRCAELCARLGVTSAERQQWDDISRKMFVAFHDDGVISQFEGYERLEEFDWEGYRQRYGDIQRLDRILEAEEDTPNRYKASKQADVLMLFYLFSSDELRALFERLGYPFAYDTIPRNVDYYKRRTSHGSTLSRVVHSWVLARSDREASWNLFVPALESDVADIQGGTTEEGIHLGAMAGTVDLIQRCYTGIETRGDTLWLNPRLPAELRRLCVRLRYRGHSLEVAVTPEKLTVRALGGIAEAIRVGHGDQTVTLAAGATREFPL